jgi:hypothetical protein
MIKLNENGRLACMMAATMASGIMANPSYNNKPLPADEMMRLASQLILHAMNFKSLSEDDNSDG